MPRGNPGGNGYEAVQRGIERIDIWPVKSVIQVVSGQLYAFGREVRDEGVVILAGFGLEAHTVGLLGYNLAFFVSPSGQMVTVWFSVSSAVEPSGSVC